MPIEITNLISTSLGIGGGAVTVGWVAKLLITRYIRDNDKKHDYASKALNKLAQRQDTYNKETTEFLQDLKVDIEVIKRAIGEVAAFRDKITSHDKQIAIAESKIDASKHDISAGFNGVRSRMEEVNKEISDLKRFYKNGVQ